MNNPCTSSPARASVCAAKQTIAAVYRACDSRGPELRLFVLLVSLLTLPILAAAAETTSSFRGGDPGLVARAGVVAAPSGGGARDVSLAAALVGNTSRLALQTVPLRKQYVPTLKDGNIVAYKTAYFGQVNVGGLSSRVFSMVFDTGSGHFILPSLGCESEACQKHQRYDRQASETAVNVEADGTLIPPNATDRDQLTIAFGTGEVLGEFVEEQICLERTALSRRTCVKLRMVLATEMSKDPFEFFSFDGVFGLGLESLALDSHFSFIGQMMRQHPAMLPQFAVFLARHDGGESAISFGGHDPSRAASELRWSPVAREALGYWQVRIRSIRVGDRALEDCANGDCYAILDTGTSLLGVPRQMTRTMHRHLARRVPSSFLQRRSGADSLDCREIPGASLHFDLGTHVVSLDAADYTRPSPFTMPAPKEVAGDLFCRSTLLPLDLPPALGPKVFIWGEPVLRRYYTVYDVGQKRVGFAKARDPVAGAAGLPPLGAPPPGSPYVTGGPLPPLGTAAAAVAI